MMMGQRTRRLTLIGAGSAAKALDQPTGEWPGD
jgi:hypothetical protein